MSLKSSSSMFKMYNDLVARASNIPNFIVGQKKDVPYDITELANNYMLAKFNNDENTCDIYFSALIVRYWHMIASIYEKIKPYNASVEDAVTILYESFNKAFKYHSWLKSDKYISKSERGAEKVINQCITSTLSNYIKALNVNKVKMFTEAVSLEDTENYLYTDDNYDRLSGCSVLVENLINNKEYLQAFLVYMIAYRGLVSKKDIQNAWLSTNSNSFNALYSFSSKMKKSDFINFINDFISKSDKNKLKLLNSCIKSLKNKESYIRSIVC